MNDLSKLKKQIKNTKDIHPLVAMLINRLLEANYHQDKFKETANFILKRIKSQKKPDSPYDKIFNDCIYSFVANKNEYPLRADVFDKTLKLKFSFKNIEILKILDTIILFDKNIAFEKQVHNDEMALSILPEKKQSDFNNYYNYDNYYFDNSIYVGSNIFYISERNNGKKGIIDDKGKVYLDFQYDTIFINTNNSDKEFFFYAKTGKMYHLLKFAYPCVLIEEFNLFEKTHEDTFRVKKGANYGWYNYKLLPIVKCEYPKLEIIAETYFTHNGIIYAVVKDLNGKYGVCHHSKGWIFPCKYDRIYSYRHSDYIVLKEGNKKIFYSLYRRFTTLIPNEIDQRKIVQLTNYRYWYYAAPHKKSGLWAVFDKKFNRLTGYYFLHPPDFLFYSREVEIYISDKLSEHDKIFWKNKKIYSMEVFFDLYGIDNVDKRYVRKKVLSIMSDKTSNVIKEEEEEILLSGISIAGTYYYDASKVSDYIRTGDELICTPEPDNKHDNNALALYWKDETRESKLGYIPRNLNKKVKILIDEHKEIKFIVSEISDYYDDINILFDVITYINNKDNSY